MADVDGRPVRLAIPAEARHLRLARLTAAGIAGEAGFTLEAIEDLRVAVDEVCAILIEGAGEDAEVMLEYRSGADGLVIEGSCPNGGGEPDLHPVARELLAMTADEYEVGREGSSVVFRLVKRRHGASP
jgi:serine/threonine-protein kinase RsbW